MSNGFHVHDLETHPTKDVLDSHVNGELTVIWRDWDKIIQDPKMIYLNAIDGNEIKGPHLHKNRISYFYCLDGELVIIIRDKDNNYHEVELNSKKSVLVEVLNGIPTALVNPSKKTSKVLVLADLAWKPNDNEMINVKFENYDWNKWKNQ
ncbi:MAG: hypothetical protein CL763_09630 [Chloroflexi bacterium]|nr:hypothetical protein [Chloroflexota bacterium]MBL77165.1 hypothetical protein [Chloroflexota bacterium]|tara:strand:+ start:25099 stop:25548 length:450 start_codon:yes stop_codon:yes gene_type:complete